MIGLPQGVRVWLASGCTDMRKGFDGLAVLVQETLREDPHGGHLFVFRGRSLNCAILGSSNSDRSALKRASVPDSSTLISRE